MSENTVVSESSDFAVIEDDFPVDDDQASSDGIEWSDPPRTRGGAKRNDDQYVPIAQALRDHAGQWAKIIEGSRNTSLVASIKQGKIKAFEPEGAFEATGRRTEDGDIAVWARFVGN